MKRFPALLLLAVVPVSSNYFIRRFRSESHDDDAVDHAISHAKIQKHVKKGKFQNKASPSRIVAKEVKLMKESYTDPNTIKFELPIAIEKGKKLGVINNFKSDYAVSFVYHPRDSTGHAILKFTADASSDYNKNLGRSFGVYWQGGNKIAIVAATPNHINPYFNSELSLNVNQDNTVLVKSQGREVKLFINGKAAGSMTLSEDRPPLSQVEVYASGKVRDDPVNGYIKNLWYYPKDGAPQQFHDEYKIQRETLIGEIIKTPSNYEITFTLKPLGKIHSQSCILRFASVLDSNAHKYGDRFPFFGFYENSYKMWVRQGSTWNTDHKIDTTMELNHNEDNLIKLTLAGKKLTLQINNKFAGSVGNVGKRTSLDKLYVYAGDKFYQPANAILKDLSYKFDDSQYFYDGRLTFSFPTGREVLNADYSNGHFETVGTNSLNVDRLVLIGTTEVKYVLNTPIFIREDMHFTFGVKSVTNVEVKRSGVCLDEVCFWTTGTNLGDCEKISIRYAGGGISKLDGTSYDVLLKDFDLVDKFVSTIVFKQEGWISQSDEEKFEYSGIIFK